MASLAGQQIKDRYIALLKTGDNGDLSANSGASAVNITDGIGTATALSLSTNRVGIGTTAPDGLLHLYSDDTYADDPKLIIEHKAAAGQHSGSIYIRTRETSGYLNDGTVIGNIEFASYDNDQYLTSAMIRAFAVSGQTNNEASGTLTFWTNNNTTSPAQRMIIDETGNVGIGITTPAATLNVVADPGDNESLVVFQNNHGDVDDNDIILKLQFSADTDASDGHFIQFADNNHTNMGAIVADSATASAAAHSDYRSKENISLMSSGLTEVNNLKPSKFNFKNYSKVMNGFIAHEVQEVIPGAVFGVKDAVDDNGDIKPQLLAMEKLIPFIVKAIQELSAKVTALETV